MGVLSGTPVDWRFDPFTETYNAVSKSNEDHAVPGSSPYRVRLVEVPREDSPSSVTAVILVELDEDLDASETGVDILAAHYGRVQVNDVLLCDDEQMQVTAKPGSPTLTVTRGYGGTTPATHSDGTLMEILASMTEIASGSPAAREFRVDYKYNTGLVLFNSAQGGYDIRFDYYGLGTPFSEGWTLGDDYVITAKILNEAVTLAKLKLAQGSDSGTVGGSSTIPVTLNAHSHFPATTGGGGDVDVFIGKPANTSSTYRISFVNNAGVGRAYAASWYYHSSSPPQEVWIEYDGDEDDIVHIWKSEPLEGGDPPIFKSRPNGKIIRLFQDQIISEVMLKHSEWKDKDKKEIEKTDFPELLAHRMMEEKTLRKLIRDLAKKETE